MDKVKGLLLVGALMAVGCAPTIMVARQKPAEINLKGIKRISIVNIDGEGGNEIEGLITEQLTNSKRFEVLERSQIQKVIQEQGRSIDKAFDNGDVQLGKLIPASALVWGQVVQSRYNEDTTQSTGKCNVNGKEVSCTTYTRRGHAVVSTQMRVFDTSAGRILAAKVLKEEASRETSAIDQSPERIDGVGLIGECRLSVAEKFLHVVAPYMVNEKVELVEDGDVPELKQGNEYIKRNDSATAVEMYGKAVARVDADPATKPKPKGRAHYALGLALAIIGDYPSALKEMKTANMLVQDSDWLDMEARIKQWQAEAAKVEQQGKDAEGTPAISAATTPVS